MNKLKFLACAVLTIFCFSTYSLEAQEKVNRVKPTAVKEARKAQTQVKRKMNKAGVNSHMKKNLKNADLKRQKITSKNGGATEIRSATRKDDAAFKRAERVSSAIANNTNSTEVGRANKALTHAKQKSIELNKKIAEARLKFEAEKREGKYTKEQVIEKEKKLTAAEEKVKQLELTVKEESSKITQAARSNKK